MSEKCKNLFMVGLYIDGERKGFISAGRPSTIRVYESVSSAKRGITANNRFYTSRGYEFKILKVGSLEEVME